MLFSILAIIALGLTIAMFATKKEMLGFPSAIFWFIFSAYCYNYSTTTWDIYYDLFMASIGMGIFSMFAAYALRTKKEELAEGDEFIDEGKDDMVFIDETPGQRAGDKYRDGVRGRADKRRVKGVQRKDEFDKIFNKMK